MEELIVIVVKNNKEVVNTQLNMLKNNGYVEIIRVNKKDVKTLNENIPNAKFKEKVIDILTLIGMPKDRLGYDYIISATLYLHKIGDTNEICIKEIYNELFHIYNKSIVSIEKAIRKTIEYTFSHGNIDEIYNLF